MRQKGGVIQSHGAIGEKKRSEIGMSDIKSMSDEELLDAIDFYMDTGTNLTSHGQADDYLVGSLKMVQFYQDELKRREKSRDGKGD